MKTKPRLDRMSSASYREAALIRACEHLLGLGVTSVSYPGGRSRESYKLKLDDGRSLIGTRRKKLSRARKEATILDALAKHTCNTPLLLADNRAQILLQEDLQGTRLSAALASAGDENDFDQIEQLLRASLTSLADIHQAGSAEKLESRFSVLGETLAWRQQLLSRPKVLGKHLGIKSPKLNMDLLTERIAVRTPRFIKWDARPGNALVDEHGKVSWFDWEHAGCRNRLDDFVWLMGDEFVPDNDALEQRLLSHLLSRFVDDLDEAEAREYIACYGCFHLTVRLGLILKHVKKQWWDRDYCIAEDRIGITLECALRTCQRGERWAKYSVHTTALSEWFNAIQQPILSLVDDDKLSTA